MAAWEWADQAYHRFRADDADAAGIARNLASVERPNGATGFTPDEIGQVKRHLFVDEHLLEDKQVGQVRAPFDADPAIAEAWIRLREGRHLDADLMLLEHELAESRYLRTHPDATYRAAHEHANARYNWAEMAPARTGEDLDTSWGQEQSGGDSAGLREGPGRQPGDRVPLRVPGDEPPAGDQQGVPAGPAAGRERGSQLRGGVREDPAIPSQRGELAGERLVRRVADQPVEGGLAGEGGETARPDDAETGPAEPERVEPLTDAAYSEHVQQVRDQLAAAREQGLATDVRYTQNGDGQTWLPERARLQRDIAAEVYAQAAGVPNERRAVMAGGLGGAGKSTVLSGHAGIDRSRYLTINPDDIKELMAARGLVPEVEGLSAMEASDLVHEESSLIAKMIAERAYAEGKNIIWDITMSSYGSVQGRLDALRAAGYTHIEGVFVDIGVETSVERAEARHRRGHEEFRAGDGYGGRYVPPEVIRANAHQEWGSVNRATFEQVRDQFNRWSVFDNSVTGRDPVRVAAGGDDGPSQAPKT